MCFVVFMQMNVTWLLGYLVDKSSSPDGTTRINLLWKESTVSESITSEDNKFHGSTTRWEKKYFWISVLAYGLKIFSLCPRRSLLGTENKVCGGVLYLLLIYLYVSVKSVRCLLTDKDSKRNLSVHNFSHFLWTESIAEISLHNHGFQVIDAYSSTGLMMLEYKVEFCFS